MNWLKAYHRSWCCSLINISIFTLSSVNRQNRPCCDRKLNSGHPTSELTNKSTKFHEESNDKHEDIGTRIRESA